MAKMLGIPFGIDLHVQDVDKFLFMKITVGTRILIFFALDPKLVPKPEV
jgi:hypothetical protein